jgi:uncharacterized protein YgiM (DUF1202 family)
MKKILLALVTIGLLMTLINGVFAQTTNPNNLPFCADLSGQTTPIVRYEIPFGTVSSGGVYCKFLVQNGTYLVNSAQIGNQQAINLGITQAVDVFAIQASGATQTVFNNAIKVCLQGTGPMFFLDANQSPRQLVQLTATSDGGYVCGSVSTAGTVLLTNSAPAVSAPAAAVGTPVTGTPVAGTPAAPTGPTTVLNACKVTTTKIVRLREESNTTSKILTRLPYNTTWTVTEKTTGWYRIIWKDTQGWVSADFVRTQGSC